MTTLSNLKVGDKVKILACRNKENQRIFLDQIVEVVQVDLGLDHDFSDNHVLVKLNDSIIWPSRTVYWERSALQLVPQEEPVKKIREPWYLELD